MEKFFGNLILAPGLGHIEENFLLTVFKFMKNIFMPKVADKLGFKSTKAKEFAINCGDHHLSWQIAMIVFEAFAKELIHVSIEHCNSEGVLPDNNRLMISCNEQVINPNFNFYYDLIFTIMLGVKSYCAGIQCDNSDYAIAGCQTVVPVMFIGNHLIYQTLIINDMQIRVEAPPEVQECIIKNESFSRSGNTYHGEGGDYITETENKHVKGHKSWCTIYCTLDKS